MAMPLKTKVYGGFESDVSTMRSSQQAYFTSNMTEPHRGRSVGLPMGIEMMPITSEFSSVQKERSGRWAVHERPMPLSATRVR